jgi:hypothetical protein
MNLFGLFESVVAFIFLVFLKNIYDVENHEIDDFFSVLICWY